MNSRPCFSRNHILVRKRRSRRRKRRRIRRKGEGERKDETPKDETPNSNLQIPGKLQIPNSKESCQSFQAQTVVNRGRNPKRQRTAALQDLADVRCKGEARQRLGVRLSSAALGCTTKRSNTVESHRCLHLSGNGDQRGGIGA